MIHVYSSTLPTLLQCSHTINNAQVEIASMEWLGRFLNYLLSDSTFLAHILKC